MGIHESLGVAAAFLQFFAFAFYIIDILRGKTKPNRITWWVLTLVSSVTAASYFASGARETIWLPLAYTFSFVSVAILSLWYGEGSVTVNRIDQISLVGVMASMLFWFLFNSPVVALFMNMLTEFIGLVPTMLKAYERPWTESKLSWSTTTFASVLNIFAIPSWRLAVSAYPIFLFITNAAVLIALFLPKKNLNHTKA